MIMIIIIIIVIVIIVIMIMIGEPMLKPHCAARRSASRFWAAP